MDWDKVKQDIGAFAATLVPQSGLIGLGTGSTSTAFINAFSQVYSRSKYSIQCLASSLEIELIAKIRGLPLLDQKDWNEDLDITFDGADAIDEEGTAIKGAGGALLREKIVAQSSKRVVLMVDERKWKKPWEESILPVVVVPFGIQATLRKLEQMGIKGKIRLHGNTPFISNDGMYTVDIPLTFALHSLSDVDRQLREIPGVVETGIFYHCATDIIIGYGDGKVDHKKTIK